LRATASRSRRQYRRACCITCSWRWRKSIGCPRPLQPRKRPSGNN
jgi:hypothetical protein